MANTDETIEFLIRYLSRFGDNRPLYQILSTALSEAVRVGVLGTDSVLPSERFLASRLSVSRVTVRRALDDLEASGLLKRQQGMRSSVTPRVEKTLSSILGFSKELLLRGVKPGQKWLGKITKERHSVFSSKRITECLHLNVICKFAYNTQLA